MMTFTLPDMSCGHCVATVTKAVKALDSGAEVKADLASKTVTVETTADPPPPSPGAGGGRLSHKPRLSLAAFPFA